LKGALQTLRYSWRMIEHARHVPLRSLRSEAMSALWMEAVGRGEAETAAALSKTARAKREPRTHFIINQPIGRCVSDFIVNVLSGGGGFKSEGNNAGL
jgi:hypothetical protein